MAYSAKVLGKDRLASSFRTPEMWKELHELSMVEGNVVLKCGCRGGIFDRPMSPDRNIAEQAEVGQYLVVGSSYKAFKHWPYTLNDCPGAEDPDPYFREPMGDFRDSEIHGSLSGAVADAAESFAPDRFKAHLDKVLDGVRIDVLIEDGATGAKWAVDIQLTRKMPLDLEARTERRIKAGLKPIWLLMGRENIENWPSSLMMTPAFSLGEIDKTREHQMHMVAIGKVLGIITGDLFCNMGFLAKTPVRVFSEHVACICDKPVTLPFGIVYEPNRTCRHFRDTAFPLEEVNAAHERLVLREYHPLVAILDRMASTDPNLARIDRDIDPMPGHNPRFVFDCPHCNERLPPFADQFNSVKSLVEYAPASAPHFATEVDLLGDFSRLNFYTEHGKHIVPMWLPREQLKPGDDPKKASRKTIEEWRFSVSERRDAFKRQIDAMKYARKVAAERERKEMEARLDAERQRKALALRRVADLRAMLVDDGMLDAAEFDAWVLAPHPKLSGLSPEAVCHSDQSSAIQGYDRMCRDLKTARALIIDEGPSNAVGGLLPIAAANRFFSRYLSTVRDRRLASLKATCGALSEEEFRDWIGAEGREGRVLAATEAQFVRALARLSRSLELARTEHGIRELERDNPFQLPLAGFKVQLEEAAEERARIERATQEERRILAEKRRVEEREWRERVEREMRANEIQDGLVSAAQKFLIIVPDGDAETWMESPSARFDGLSPRQLIERSKEGAARVAQELDQVLNVKSMNEARSLDARGLPASEHLKRKTAHLYPARVEKLRAFLESEPHIGTEMPFEQWLDIASERFRGHSIREMMMCVDEWRVSDVETALLGVMKALRGNTGCTDLLGLRLTD